MKKQILAALAVISVLANVAYCGTYSGGTGEPGNPYRIATANDLNDIANHPNDFDKHFILVNDINLAEYTGTQFNIIGNDVNAFTGVFDGNDHTISNFTYNSTGVDYIGLFGYVGDLSLSAEVKNVGLIDPNVYAETTADGGIGALIGKTIDANITNCYVEGGSVSGDNGGVGGLVGSMGRGTITGCFVEGGSVSGSQKGIGGLAGYAWGGDVIDCHASVSVDGGDGVGGLVGINALELNSTIRNCYATGSVSGVYRVGGLVGINGHESIFANGTISNSYATGNVVGIAGVGGLVGYNYNYSLAQNCYSSGNVTATDFAGGLVGINTGFINNSSSSGNVTGTGKSVGGLVGENYGHSGGISISNSYSTSNVEGTTDVGGFAGGNIGTIENCYSQGDVVGDVNVGGLVGFNKAMDLPGGYAILNNCYSASSVSADSNLGGLVGYDDDGSYTKSFWDRNVNPDVNGIGNTTDPNVIGETTVNMQRRNTFTDAGWDFVGETANGPNDIWTIRENRDYPRLWWQQMYMPGERSIIKNGSFEADGPIGDIDAKAPKYWCDVSLPENKFYGYVDDDWGTQGYDSGNYRSLTIYSFGYGTFNVNDMGTVSQQVYFEEDVNELIFDVKLATDSGSWDPADRTAFVLIDGNTVWESNSVGSDVRGEYLDQSYTIEDQYKDANTHTLTLGLRANVSGTPFTDYYAHWDFIKFDKYCGGLGYLSGDFDLDCYIDMNDFKELIDRWLVEGPGERYDLLPDGIIDFYDFSLFAGYWMANTYWENWGDNNCYQVELLISDIDDSGEVDYGDMLVLVDNWLDTGSCVRADLNFDGIVDFKDFAIIARDWQKRSWLYWVQ